MTINKFLLAFSLLALVNPASATPNRFTVVNPNSNMVAVPNIGLSRVESVTFCLNEVGRDRYVDLITDSDFQRFESCLQDLT